jgi:hypothetical protein
MPKPDPSITHSSENDKFGLRVRGSGGTGRRPAFVKFEPSSFLRLYQTAHLESTVDKRDNSPDLTKRSAANSLALLPRSTVMCKQPAINRALRGGKKRTPSGIGA